MKIVGDHYRYIAENVKGDLFEEASQKALQYYGKAYDIKLSACNVVKLGIVLNFSICLYKLVNKRSGALQLAESALIEALRIIDVIDEEAFNNAKSIIMLINENLLSWKETKVLYATKAL